MPTFPTYHGELPKCLSPLNLRHYLLLIYWIYFRPTALKCYLYQSDPDLYCMGPGRGILSVSKNPQYRNLYLMIPGIVMLVSVVIVLPAIVAVGLIRGTPIPWMNLLLWVIVSMVLGLLAGIVGSILGSLTTGTSFGLIAGLSIGTMSGVMFGLVLGSRGGIQVSAIAALPIQVVAGIVISVALGFTVVTFFSVMFGLSAGVAGGLVASLMTGVAVALFFSQGSSVTIWKWVSVLGGTATGMVVFMGVLRIPVYFFQFILTLCGISQYIPWKWDELVSLPLPRARQTLIRILQQNKNQGIYNLIEVTRNPFQRWVAQTALKSYLHSCSLPLRFIYALLTHSALNSYIFAPVRQEDWERRPSVKKVLLGELDSRWVDCSSDWGNRLPEFLIWGVTWLFRDRRRTSLSQFAGMLYDLLDEKTVEADAFDLTTYKTVYNCLIDYSGSEEIGHSFTALATCLICNDLAALPNAVGQDSVQTYENPIRPTVLVALARLGQVGAEVAAYHDATSRVNQLAALARATDSLDSLDEYVLAEVMAPEQYILRRIVRQWRRLVSEAGGEAGRLVEAGPVANPYVAGNPVGGNLFVGREDVMRRLEELWVGEGQKPSVILYGHRRMGKSSILHNLGARFGLDTVIVDFNMQRMGLVESAGELLYNLALALYDSLPNLQEGLGEPDAARFADHNPYTAFDRFLRQIDRVRDDRRFIVTVDEFELIERAIEENQLEARLLDFWRGLIQTYPWFVMVFAGLHTLQEMTRDYWHPLYGSVTPIPVSFLSHEAARRLITQPTPEFSLDYDRDAVESIIALTNGQPYLVQFIGHGLVTRFNRQTFEEGIERERRFSLVDVEAVINAPEFYRDGDAYFTGVWRQAETSEPLGQTAALHAMVQSEKGTPIDVIARRAALAPEKVAQALQALARHDVVAKVEGQWGFTVELMHRWVAQR